MPNPGSVTSTFFNNYYRSSEQRLAEDLITESISIYGLDFSYLPRKINNLDEIYLQDDVSSYEQAIQIAVYVRSFEGFEGDGNFMSKFGLEIRDRITFTISEKVFKNEIGIPYNLIRPREGDLLYYPLNNKVFQIKYVENKPIHYPLGILPTYDMFCELFEYSNEVFNTGIPEIDRIQLQLSTDVLDYAILTDIDQPIADDSWAIITTDKYNLDAIDPIEDNTEIDAEANTIVDWSETNPFAEENWTP